MVVVVPHGVILLIRSKDSKLLQSTKSINSACDEMVRLIFLINSLVVVLSHVRLLLILLALGLAIGAVPVHQHHQGQHEHEVGDQDCVCDRGQRLRPKMLRIWF